MVDGLGFSRRYVADPLQQTVMVEPGHPVQRCQLDRVWVFHGCRATRVNGSLRAYTARCCPIDWVASCAHRLVNLGCGKLS